MADVAMPRLSDSMEEGTILKWLKSDGDEVQRGEELVEIETDKANMTYEADQAGVLKIVAQEGDTLPVGDTIAKIGEGDSGGDEGGAADEAPAEDEAQDAPSRAAPRSPSTRPRRRRSASSRTEPVATEERPQPEPDEGNGRVKASPIARRMARDLGVELSGISGSGPGGRIVKADVEAAAGNGKQAAEGEAEAPAEEAPEREEAPKRGRPRAGRVGRRGHRPRRDDGRGPDAGCSRRSRAGWPSPRRRRPSSS